MSDFLWYFQSKLETSKIKLPFRKLLSIAYSAAGYCNVKVDSHDQQVLLCYILQGLLGSVAQESLNADPNIRMICLFDNEEVGQRGDYVYNMKVCTKQNCYNKNIAIWETGRVEL